MPRPAGPPCHARSGLATPARPRQKPAVTAAPASSTKPPGFLWILVLGAAGFCAGFFGPMVFVPESNLGPIVGIFFSGPGGVVLGLAMYLVMKVAPLPARGQWILLTILATTGALVTLACVQPEPATRGYEVELQLVRSLPPGDAADAVVADWKKRIAHATWAQPRAGWEPQMRAALAADPGLVVEAVVLRERAIKEHRKPWNRGRLFATPWQAPQQTRFYYLRAADRALAAAASPAPRFIRADSTEPIRGPDIWPPVETEAFLGYSRLEALPADYAALP